jgi:hypothetical protein
MFIVGLLNLIWVRVTVIILVVVGQSIHSCGHVIGCKRLIFVIIIGKPGLEDVKVFIANVGECQVCFGLPTSQWT